MVTYRPIPAPSMWRVAVIVLIIALAANTMLWSLRADDDTFAAIVAVASGLAAIGLIVHRFVFEWLMGEALFVSFIVWTANAIEFATEDGIRWQSQVRQCGFYGAFAILSLGAYVATRKAPPNG